MPGCDITVGRQLALGAATGGVIYLSRSGRPCPAKYARLELVVVIMPCVLLPPLPLYFVSGWRLERWDSETFTCQQLGAPEDEKRSAQTERLGDTGSPGLCIRFKLVRSSNCGINCLVCEEFVFPLGIDPRRLRN